MDTCTDAELLTRYAQAQDEQAFDQLMHRHAGLVAGVCRRTAGMPLAEDAVQATFLALSRRAAHVSGHPCVAGWLHAAATRIGRGMRRQAARRARREQIHAAMPRATAPEVAMTTAPDGEELDAAIAALPERYRHPLVLHYLEGLSQAQVAAQLGVTENTIAQQLSRARHRLKHRLAWADAQALTALGAGGSPPLLPRTIHAFLRNPASVPTHLCAEAFARPTSRGDGFVTTLCVLAATFVLSTATSLQLQAAPMHALGPAAAVQEPPPTPPVPAPAAPPGWPNQVGWDASMRTPLANDRIWVAAGARPLAQATAHPPGIWACIGSAAHEPHAHAHDSSARDGTTGWTAGVPLVGENDALWKDAAGTDLDAARSDAPLLIALSAVLDREEEWTPYSVEREDHVISVVMDRWTGPRLQAGARTKACALLLDLGLLAPGAYTVRLVERTFFAQGPGLGSAWVTTRFASKDVPIAAAPVTSPAPVTAAPSLLVSWSDAGSCPGMGLVRSGRQVPLRRTATIPWRPGEGGVVDPCATWIAALPEDQADALMELPRLPSVMPSSPARTGRSWRLVMVGPAFPRAAHMSLLDRFGSAQSLCLRMQLFLDAPAPGNQPLQRALMEVRVAAADLARGLPALDHGNVNWQVRGPEGRLVQEFGCPIVPSWQVLPLADVRIPPLSPPTVRAF